MEPSRKSAAIEDLLTEFTGVRRSDAIRDSFCMPDPIGCGRKIYGGEFRDKVSLREYQISGLCQSCQDKVFGEFANET